MFLHLHSRGSRVITPDELPIPNSFHTTTNTSDVFVSRNLHETFPAFSYGNLVWHKLLPVGCWVVLTWRIGEAAASAPGAMQPITPGICSRAPSSRADGPPEGDSAPEHHRKAKGNEASMSCCCCD